MPINGFDFPKVTLKQSYASTPAATSAQLSVCCIGPQYKLHKANKESEAAMIDQSKTQYNKSTGLVADLPMRDRLNKLDTEKRFQHLVVKNGVFSYYIVNGSDAFTVAAGHITFKTINVADGDSYLAAEAFGTRGVRVGDPLYIGGTDQAESPKTVFTEVLKIDKDQDGRYNTIIVPAGDISGLKTVSSVTFCEYAEATYDAGEDTFSIGEDDVVHQTVAKVTVKGGLTTKLYDLNDKVAALEKGDLFVEYRESCSDYVGKLGSIVQLSDIEDILGTPCEDNPLALACYFAFRTAANHVVYFSAVRSNDIAGYAEAMDYTNSFHELYSIVPATEDEGIIKTCVQSCVAASSDAESGIRRACWYGITQEDEPLLWKGTGIWEVSENMYKVMLDGRMFIDYPAMAGDVLRLTAYPYTEYEIVATDDVNLATVKVPEGADTPNDADSALFEYVRKRPTPADLVNGIIRKRQRRSQSERAVCCWADGLLFNGELVSNFALAAAAAGMRSGEACHRPLSNLGYDFFTLADTHGFTRRHLLQIGSNGIWIVANNIEGKPINKKQITTAVANNINLDEESIIANADSVAMSVINVGQNLVGCSNINDTLLVVITTDIQSILDSFTVNKSESVYVGPQLLGYELLQVYQDKVNLDRVYADFTITPPKPFNELHMTMRVL